MADIEKADIVDICPNCGSKQLHYYDDRFMCKTCGVEDYA